MSAKRFCYVVIDKMLRPRIAQSQATLFKYLQESPESDVRTFYTQEEAEKVVDAHMKLYSLVSAPKLEKGAGVDFSFPTQMEPDLEHDDFSEDLSSQNHFSSPQQPSYSAQKSRNYSNPDQYQQRQENYVNQKVSFEEGVRKEEPVSAPPTSSYGQSDEKKDFQWNAYYFFREDEQALERVKNSINPEKIYHLFFDGSVAEKLESEDSGMNKPGKNGTAGGAGYAIYDENNKRVYTNSVYAGLITPSAAEYYGLIFGMKSCQNLGIKKIYVHGNSTVVINQVTKKYEIKAQYLFRFYYEVANLMQDFEEVKFEIIQKEQNVEADTLSKLGVALYRPKKAENTSTYSNTNSNYTKRTDYKGSN